ncbi:cytochrome P450 [Actinospica robiniae]|uniref:cytochrome P450 n=1 Tax=Actinospica robiniae TaxID=304901 RepID=UPI000415CFDD|nr:cytochrome P450 [Actinospica robiniae]
MAAKEHRFSRYADVVEALADPVLVPIPPRESDEAPEIPAPGTSAWLRATVARFAAGPTHQRRRTTVEADLQRLDPVALRRAATGAAARAARIGGAPADARSLAVRVLAEAYGLPDPDAVAADVRLVAGVYFGGHDEAADAAVARLMAVLISADEPLLPSTEEHESEARLEAAANRIGILVQACDATGTLVDNALRALAEDGGDQEVDEILAETLRYDPPVRTMRRIALQAAAIGGVEVREGDTVTLDIAAANREPEVCQQPTGSLTFGADPRHCPGWRHAFALAAGILDLSRAPQMTRNGPTELDEAA